MTLFTIMLLISHMRTAARSLLLSIGSNEDEFLGFGLGGEDLYHIMESLDCYHLQEERQSISFFRSHINRLVSRDLTRIKQCNDWGKYWLQLELMCCSPTLPTIRTHFNGLVQERRNSIAMHWSYVFLALTYPFEVSPHAEYRKLFSKV